MKQIINRMELRFPSGSVNESFARGAVSAFVLCLDPLVTDLNDLKTAVSEAVTNCIVHAYPDCIGKILMRCRILEDNRLEIVIRDWGRGIEDIGKARKPLYTTGGEERSGMGFTIMENFMDKLTVRSTPGEGTSVIMLRTLPRRVRDR